MSTAHMILALLAMLAFGALAASLLLVPKRMERGLARKRTDRELQDARWLAHRERAAEFAALLEGKWEDKVGETYKQARRKQ